MAVSEMSRSDYQAGGISFSNPKRRLQSRTTDLLGFFSSSSPEPGDEEGHSRSHEECDQRLATHLGSPLFQGGGGPSA